MQPKKNEKADLTKNSSLYFVIGLTSMFIVPGGSVMTHHK